MKPRSSAEERALSKLKQLLANRRRGDLFWYYEVGECVIKLHPWERRDYGKSRIEELAEQLRPEGAGRYALSTLLWHARAVTNKYSKVELADLHARAQANGMNMAWSHVELLAELPLKQRRRVEDRCIRYRWPVSELRAQLYAEKGKKTTKSRPPTVPRHRLQKIEKLARAGRHWLALCEALVPKLGVSISDQDPAKDTSFHSLLRLLVDIEREAKRARKQLQEPSNLATPRLKKPAGKMRASRRR